MKNKKVTFVLIVSVAAVWGIIFYRIFAAAGEDEQGFQSRPPFASSYESLDDYRIKDTFHLALNYRDPFLGKEMKADTLVVAGSKTSVSSVVQKHAPVPKPAVNWDAVKYTGYIINPLSKRIVSIITVSGTEHMLSEGQSAGGVKLIKCMRDSVKVIYMGKTRFIKQQ